MALTDSLILYLDLDEASGNAIDAHGSNDLTETSGTIAAGGSGGRDFEAGDTEYFAINDNTDVSVGDEPFTIAAWVNLESKGVKRPIFSKQNNGADGSYDLRYDSGSDRFQLRVWGSSGFGNGSAGGEADNLGSPALATWYFIVAWHDSVSNEIGIQVNDGTPDTASHTAGVYNDNGQLQLGASAVWNEYFDGLIRRVGFWKRVLTSDERTELYNGGAGLAYADLDAGGGGSVIKTIDTIAIASVKTINTIAIASVKTRDGISNV